MVPELPELESLATPLTQRDRPLLCSWRISIDTGRIGWVENCPPGVHVAEIDHPSVNHRDGDRPEMRAEHRNLIQDGVFGAAVQARDIYGGVHVHQQDPVLPRPR